MLTITYIVCDYIYVHIYFFYMFLLKYPFLIYLCIHTYCTYNTYWKYLEGFFYSKCSNPHFHRTQLIWLAMKQPEITLISILLENL